MGGSVLTVAIFLCAVTAIAIRFYLQRLNTKMDMAGGHAEATVQAAHCGTQAQKAFPLSPCDQGMKKPSSNTAFAGNPRVSRSSQPHPKEGLESFVLFRWHELGQWK